MRTTHLLTVSHSIPWGVYVQGGWADPPGHVTCDACWEDNPLPSPCELTNTCEDITLPQTLFAGSN